MIRLFQFTPADLDYISQVSANLRQQFDGDAAFAREQTVERILVLATLLRKSSEFLHKTLSF